MLVIYIVLSFSEVVLLQKEVAIYLGFRKLRNEASQGGVALILRTNIGHLGRNIPGFGKKISIVIMWEYLLKHPTASVLIYAH